MLIPKLITTFLTLLFCIIAFSLVYFLLQNLPKAQITIEYKLKEENPFSSHLCQLFLDSKEIRDLLIKIIKNENLENSKNLLLIKISNIFEDRGFEIVIDNESLKKGNLIYNDIYTCYLFHEEKIYEIKVKI